LTGFTVAHPHGGKEHYGKITTVGGSQVALLTEKEDRLGHTNRFGYLETNSMVLLKYVIDADGHANKLSYTNGSFPAQITEVEDAFGRKTLLKYNSSGLLTNVVDPVGLSSSFKYDSWGWVTNLTTPYGTHSFYYYTNTPSGAGNEFLENGDYGEYFITRAVIVADPLGGTNIYALRQDSAILYTNFPDYTDFLPAVTSDPAILPGQIPVAQYIDSTYNNYRNTFHWRPRQATGLPGDLNHFLVDHYRKAHRRHWHHDTQVSGSLLGPSSIWTRLQAPMDPME